MCHFHLLFKLISREENTKQLVSIIMNTHGKLWKDIPRAYLEDACIATAEVPVSSTGLPTQILEWVL